MKIAVNTRILQSPMTGIQNFILHLYSYLPVHDHASEYLFFQTSKTGALGKKSIITLPNTGLFNLLFDLFLVHFLILKHRPDIFHGPSHLLPIIKAPGTKYVLTIHDLSFITLPHIMNRLWSALYRLFTGISVRNADLIITDSDSTRNDVLRVFKASPAKVHFIHLGLPDHYLTIEPQTRPHPRPYLLSVATHPLRKNILSSIKAFAGSAQTNSKFDYIVVGPGSTDSRIQAEVSALGLDSKVFLKGVVEEKTVRAYYQYADLFIYPSLYEGFGFPILEAMSQKTLVLASGVSSMPELFPDQDYLVDPLNIADIKLKMEQLLTLSSQEKSRIIDKNWRFSKTFTWEKCASSYLRSFSKVSIAS